MPPPRSAMMSRHCEDVPQEYLTTYPGTIALFELLFAVIALGILVRVKAFNCGFRLHTFRLIIMMLVFVGLFTQKPLLLLAYLVLKVTDAVLLVHFLAKLIFPSKDKRVNLFYDETLADHQRSVVAGALILLAVSVYFGYVFYVTIECMPPQQ